MKTILINLFNHLSAKGHNVIVYNNCHNNDITNNWKNLNSIKADNIEFDIAISNADANLFNDVKAKKKFVFYEVPISYKGRSYEEGKKITLKDAFVALFCIFKYRFFN